MVKGLVLVLAFGFGFVSATVAVAGTDGLYTPTVDLSMVREKAQLELMDAKLERIGNEITGRAATCILGLAVHGAPRRALLSIREIAEAAPQIDFVPLADAVGRIAQIRYNILHPWRGLERPSPTTVPRKRHLVPRGKVFKG